MLHAGDELMALQAVRGGDGSVRWHSSRRGGVGVQGRFGGWRSRSWSHRNGRCSRHRILRSRADRDWSRDKEHCFGAPRSDGRPGSSPSRSEPPRRRRWRRMTDVARRKHRSRGGLQPAHLRSAHRGTEPEVLARGPRNHGHHHLRHAGAPAVRAHRWPDCYDQLPATARLPLLLALIAFVVAAICGLATNIPLIYQEATPRGLAKLVDARYWTGPATVGQLRVAAAQVTLITAARLANNLKVRLLIAAVTAELLAIVFLCWAVASILYGP